MNTSLLWLHPVKGVMWEERRGGGGGAHAFCHWIKCSNLLCNYAAATWKRYHTRSELFNVIVSRTTLHQIKIIKPNYCPPGQVPTRTTPHQDHYQPVKPLMRTNTYTVGNCPGRELSGYGSELFNVIGSRTTPHWMKIKPNYCPPESWSIGPLPTKTTSNQ